MKILTVIVTYNAMQWIERCLDSLRKSSIATDVFVDDNCSTDNTIEYITTHYPEVVIKQETGNLGFGQANNNGLRYAIDNNYDYVLLLNQDAWIEQDMIQKLLNHADENTLLSPIHLNGRGDDLDRNFQRNAVEKGGWKTILQEDALLSKGSKKYETQEINAACWLMPRRMIESSGGFNPLFYHYGEDVNYLARLQYHGYSICFITGTYVYHNRENREEAIVDYTKIYRDLLMIQTDINLSKTECKMKSFRYLIGLTHTMIDRKQLLFDYYIQALKELRKRENEIEASRKKEMTP